MLGNFGRRPQEVRAVGAWVQPEVEFYRGIQEAVVSAQVEEQRMRRKQREKDEKLKRFQDEVRKRVKALSRLKREQQLEKSYKAVELQSNVVKQSTFAAEKFTPRKDRCDLRDEEPLKIQPSPLRTQGAIIRGHDSNKENLFENHSHQVHKYVRQARRNLGSRKVITDDFVPDDLPGGVWGVSATRDHPAARSTVEPEVIDLEDQDDGNAWQPEDDKIARQQGEAALDIEKKSVRFDLARPTEETRRERIARRSATHISGSDIERNIPLPPAPNIYPGVTNEEERKRAVTQRAMYRRLFMDIEREQVKENLRRKEHRMRVAKLKREKEEERQLEEDRARYLVAAKDPLTGETETETLRRHELEERLMQETEFRRWQAEQKRKETERYLEALRHNLMEKTKRRKLHLPPLCACGGDSVWDTNPNTCANNCIFYKNPKAYAKALQSLLVSCDVV